jgi:hypothetical protein
MQSCKIHPTVQCNAIHSNWIRFIDATYQWENDLPADRLILAIMEH